MGKFVFELEAREDIQLLSFKYPIELTTLRELFRQLAADDDLFNKIWEDGYGEFRNPEDKVNVLKWRKAHEEGGRGLWRLKSLELERNEKLFRVFYCMHDGNAEIARVLAVIQIDKEDKSEFDYDNLKSPVADRLLRAYDRVCNPQR
ncbi:hypothetical protein H4P35_06960 [Achromobacter sp. 77]|uniref:hypothetical protein n=1 Tax=Achromobacter sp. 77 TaxID=2756133 RepID=UPI001D020847|nr:hypothetical protein [Achromobacter sp. 77]UDG77080.1 hypothetical protein H4P35_06960 [Achromobacter sp. 77]